MSREQSPPQTKPTRQDLFKIAAEANVDPRTALRWLEGKPVKSESTHNAIASAVQRLKLAHLVARSA